MNTEHPIPYPDEEVFYIHKLDHRNKSPQKSQWTISEQEERNCFIQIVYLIYKQSFGAWGLHIVDGKCEYLGKASAQSPKPFEDLFIAKFVDSQNTHKWHGYPVSHMNNPDKPPQHVLTYWFEQKYLSRSKIRKIMTGVSCKL